MESNERRTTMMWWNNGMGYGMGWGGGWVLMAALMVAFWGGLVIVGGVMALFRTIGADRHPPYDTDATSRPSADKILDERFARGGEIDAEEYRIRRDQLRTGHDR